MTQLCRSVNTHHDTPSMLSAALSKKKKSQPDDWIKTIWPIGMAEFYSAVKENEIVTFARKWMEIEIIL